MRPRYPLAMSDNRAAGALRSGQRVRLEDETGVINVVVRPDLYEAQRSTIRGEPYLCIEGTVQLQSGTLNLLATRAIPLGHLTADAASLLRAPERNGVPGNPHDKREAASAELALATPASRDFH